MGERGGGGGGAESVTCRARRTPKLSKGLSANLVLRSASGWLLERSKASRAAASAAFPSSVARKAALMSSTGSSSVSRPLVVPPSLIASDEYSSCPARPQEGPIRRTSRGKGAREGRGVGWAQKGAGGGSAPWGVRISCRKEPMSLRGGHVNPRDSKNGSVWVVGPW